MGSVHEVPRFSSLRGRDAEGRELGCQHRGRNGRRPPQRIPESRPRNRSRGFEGRVGNSKRGRAQSPRPEPRRFGLTRDHKRCCCRRRRCRGTREKLGWTLVIHRNPGQVQQVVNILLLLFPLFVMIFIIGMRGRVRGGDEAFPMSRDPFKESEGSREGWRPSCLECSTDVGLLAEAQDRQASQTNTGSECRRGDGHVWVHKPSQSDDVWVVQLVGPSRSSRTGGDKGYVGQRCRQLCRLGRVHVGQPRADLDQGLGRNRRVSRGRGCSSHGRGRREDDAVDLGL